MLILYIYIYIYIYIYTHIYNPKLIYDMYITKMLINQLIVLVSRVFTNCPRRPGFNPRSRHTKDFKMVFDTSLLNTQQYKVHIKVKWSNPGKGVVPSPTPRCSRYWKGSLQVANFTFYLYISQSKKTQWTVVMLFCQVMIHNCLANVHWVFFLCVTNLLTLYVIFFNIYPDRFIY